MKYLDYLGLLFLLLIFIGPNLTSCTSDQLEEVIIDTSACDSLMATYDEAVGVIINSTCNLPGCHNAGSVFGDFTTYSSDLLSSANSGEFESRVIINRDDPVLGMPRGDSLTDDQIDIMQCWIENEFPE